MDEIDTLNRAMVGMRGNLIVVVNPAAVREMSRDHALVLAAHLVALADDDAGEVAGLRVVRGEDVDEKPTSRFQEILAAVLNA